MGGRATDAIIDAERFGEIVALNRGVDVKTFSDWNAAVAWLREDSPL